MTNTTLLPRVNARVYPSLPRAGTGASSRTMAISARPRFRDEDIVHLPARAAEAVETVRLPVFSPLVGSSLAPLALVADDDMDVRKALRLVLEISGYRVEEAGGAMQALAILHHNPSVVLLDINMPGLNGVECLHEIHKRRPDMKVIIISGRLDVEASLALEIGAFDYIPKPIDIHQLLAAVGRATDKENAKDQAKEEHQAAGKAVAEEYGMRK